MNLTVSGPGRIAALDIARGFAILAVVASHAQLLWAPAAPWIYEFYVPLFFVLAGYLASASRPLQRLGRMVRQYFTVCAVLFVIWFVLYPLRGEDTDLIGRAVFSVVYGRFYDPANPVLVNCLWAGQLWFLTLLVTATALFYLVRRLLGPPWRLAVALVVLLAAAQLLRATPVLLPWCLDTAPMGAAYMLMGHALAGLDFARQPFQPRQLPLLIVCAVAYIQRHDTYDLNLRVYGQYADWRGTVSFFLAGTAGTVLCIAVCALLARVPLVSTVLQAAGRHSMEIFCWHIFGLWVLDSVWMRLPDAFPADAPVARLLFAALALVGVPLLCVLICSFFAKKEPKKL